MPSRAIKAAGTRWPTCASCTDGAIIGIINGWDTKQQRLEPDAEQSARPVLRGAPDSNAVAPTRLCLRAHLQPGDGGGRTQACRPGIPARTCGLGGVDYRAPRGIRLLGRVREEPAADCRQRTQQGTDGPRL